MNMLEELRHLDPNDPGKWPAPVRAIALFVLMLIMIGAGYYFILQDQLNSLDSVRAEEQTLKDSYLVKKRSAVNLPVLKQQLIDIERSLSALLKQLPNKSEMEALLVDINQAGLGRGLQFELFKPAENETIHEFYAELPVSVRVTGGYHDIGSFASDIAQLPRIVTLNNINIVPGAESTLTLDAVAKTFRYLDENEMINQGTQGQ
ncbi:type 4a pilus biogenesis protein PilO [Nitrosomonas sp.]|uniref:type 4a pilus biogenesis protein PilO n=1 Tax=Nitrosomonas sp. TaxID=42353 RepID=UPI001DE335CF|nr:type 4a pilus biogenesis protein PilO [Nitrosomonas sp.]MCB1947661.1 type 4a pilus biogenesis protein PilO [Nitrosomonas sp.]MCP5241963.1 type 4a pilus biogenesis protein PilO [Burkholderiales bacterium]MDR4513296.1 type 4a pilus biogenesis protein PilO [Nitrosomonas sp.]